MNGNRKQEFIRAFGRGLKPVLVLPALAISVALITLTSCSATALATLVPTVAPASTEPSLLPKVYDPTSYTGLSTIVNLHADWPRYVRTDNGTLKIASPPQRILALSVGHNEIIVDILGDTERFAGIGTYSDDPEYSNVAERVQHLTAIPAEAEAVVAAAPDLVILSKFTPASLETALRELEIPVYRSALNNSADGNITNILLLGYVLGAENEAAQLAQAVITRLSNVTSNLPDTPYPTAIALTNYGSSIWTAGTGSTEGGIIENAGAENAAAVAEIESNQIISLESIIAMAPEIIVIPQPANSGGQEFKEFLMDEPLLAQVPAIQDGQIFLVNSKYFTTLSHWNVCGIEASAAIFHSTAFEPTEVCKPF